MEAAEHSSLPGPLARPAEVPEHFLHLLALMDRLRSEQGLSMGSRANPQESYSLSVGGNLRGHREY